MVRAYVKKTSYIHMQIRVYIYIYICLIHKNVDMYIIIIALRLDKLCKLQLETGSKSKEICHHNQVKSCSLISLINYLIS